MGLKKALISLVGKIPFSFRTKIKAIPGLKQLQSALIKNWISDENFIATISGGPAKGLVFRVQMPQDKLMWIGTWELDFARALQQAMKPGWVCYDIGGYKGYYAGIMALAGAAEVHVFEPMPGNALNISKLIKLNPRLPIFLRQVAVADNNEPTEFKLMPENTMGKLSSSVFQKWETAKDTLTVECQSLDALCDQGLPPANFIKIDVEGAEELVLKGALNLIQNKRPLLMIEVHSREIGKRCEMILQPFYPSIKVLETGNPPGDDSPEICHYIVSN